MDILRQRRINVLADDSRFMRYCLKRKTEDLSMSNEAAEQIALDGIAVIVNKDNGVEGLSSEQIRQIFVGEVTNWAQLG